MEENTVTAEVTEADVKQKNRGNRGELGVATPSLTIKKRWHAWLAENNLTPEKRGYVSLKAWARLQLKTDDGVAKTWLSFKHGLLDKKRSDANIKAAREAGTATRAAHRKKKGEGGSK